MLFTLKQVFANISSVVAKIGRNWLSPGALFIINKDKKKTNKYKTIVCGAQFTMTQGKKEHDKLTKISMCPVFVWFKKKTII